LPHNIGVLRDKNLVPLSRQHQHALALCVRLDRAMQAGLIDTDAWQSEIQQHFEQEISVHFSAEEKELFPRAAEFEETKPLVDELRSEHAQLRGCFARATSRSLSAGDLAAFVETLARHIRKEERQLFEALQKLMSAEELASLGARLEAALKDASQACNLPSEATRAKQ